MFPLALAPFIPAAAAGIGAFAKGVQRYAPQIRGGIDTINRYANPIMNKMFSSSINVPLRYFDKGVSKATKAPNMFSAITPSLGVYNYADDLPQLITDAGYFSGADDASKLITGEGESGFLEDLGLFDAAGALIDKITGNDSKDKKDKKKKKETKKNEDSSTDDNSMPPSNWMDELIEAEYEAEKNKKEKNLKKRWLR
jgi:hypothetical protein